MKKLFILLLAVMVLLALSACGGAGGDEPAGEPAELGTLGDALSAESSYYYSACDSSYYVYVFDNNGTPCRVVAEMTEDLYDAFTAIEFTDPDKDQKMMDLLGDLPLIRVDDLSQGIPSQAELDQLAGKTGQELLDQGFQVWGYDEEADEYSLVQGDYEYKASFNEKAENSTGDDDAIRGLTLKSIVYDGVSTNAADIELP